jgi:hypothetical protein
MSQRTARLCFGVLLLACAGWLAYRESPRRALGDAAGARLEPSESTRSVARGRRRPAAIGAAPSAPATASAVTDPRPFAETEARRILTDHFEVAKQSGDAREMEEAYAMSMTILRAYAKEVVPLLHDALRNERNMEEKHLLVETLGELESSHAFGPLVEVARLPLPPNPDPHDHHDSRLSEERILRSIAVEGLARLANNGDARARQLLFDMAVDPAYQHRGSIRVDAILGFVGTGPEAPARAEAIRNQVPADLAWTLKPRRPFDPAAIAHATLPE